MTLFELLREKFPPAAFALFAEVRDQTGFAGSRSADAVMMSLWPSHGLGITGFEFKASRSDWLRELKQPEKADAIFVHCNRWFLVAESADIVKKEELPPTWGLMVRTANGDKLRLVVERAAIPRPGGIDRGFVASLLREAQGAALRPVEDLRRELREEAAAAREKAVEEYSDKARRCDNAEDNFKLMADRIETFERASGINISQWSAGQVGNAARIIAHNPRSYLDEFRRSADGLRQAADRASEALAEIEAMVKNGSNQI